MNADIIIKCKDFRTEPFEHTTYDHCIFEQCDFSGVKLSLPRADTIFEECVFRDCNFSNANVSNVAFREVKFIGCKLVGVVFAECHPFLLAMQFDQCDLSMADLHALALPNTLFRKCLLRESDFTRADVHGAQFVECDMARAIFDATNLEKADFRTAVNYALDPERNRIKKARFSADGLEGLLLKYGIVVE